MVQYCKFSAKEGILVLVLISRQISHDEKNKSFIVNAISHLYKNENLKMIVLTWKIEIVKSIKIV